MVTREDKIQYLSKILVKVDDHIKGKYIGGLCLTAIKIGTSEEYSWFRSILPEKNYNVLGEKTYEHVYCFKHGDNLSVIEAFYHYRVLWLEEQIKKLEDEK